MPSYTDLKILLMDNGTEDTTWGGETNANWEAINAAIAGTATVTFSSADETLLLVNTNSAQDARNMRIVCTGVSGGARNLNVPVQPKFYVVQNDLADTLTVKTVAGTGVAVPTGRSVFVYCDGVNVVNGITHFANLTATSPDFTGTPTAPTAAPGTNTTQLATTAFVQNVAGNLGTMSTQNANNVAITGGSVSGVTLASAAASFTGTPTAPTAAPGTNTTQIATTAFVQNVAGSLGTMSTQNANNVAITGGSVTGVTAALTGTPTAPTAAPGTNTTQIATTAFATAAIAAAVLNQIYPVGSIYTNATNATNPASLLGFGTWVAFGAGRVMVGFNASDPLFDAAEETGGSKDAVVVSHTHTATSSTSITDPGHNHPFYIGQSLSQGLPPTTGWNVAGSFSGKSNGSNNIQNATTGVTASTSTTVASTGSSGTNANLQPYITVYMWKRTA
jgi:hypothetical protein